MRAATIAVWIFFLSASSIALQAQSTFVKTNKGQTEFFSKAAGPAQDIYAIDKTGTVQLNLNTGSIEAKVAMKNFSLPRSLMQKHYNEKYMETAKYPYTVFKGTILNWKQPEKEGSMEVVASGEFTCHGVTRPRQLKGTLTKNKDTYLLETVFEVKLADHGIEIPVLFFTEITNAVKVTAKYSLEP